MWVLAENLLLDLPVSRVQAQGQPIGPERLRCHYSALKFLYGRTLGQPEKVSASSSPCGCTAFEHDCEAEVGKAKGAYKGRKPALTQEQATQVRARAAAGEKKAVLARDYKISRETLYQYLRG